jgi:DNA repair protein RadC
MGQRYAFNVKASIMQVREPATRSRVVDACDVFKDMRDVGGFAQEAFFVLTLNHKGQMIDRYMISLGTLTATLVHPREVFRPAIHDGASTVIVVHNHPSGNPEPSRHDRDLTGRLVEAGTLLGIKVTDHVIIGDGTYYSFAAHGLM